MAPTHKEGLVVGMRNMPGNPYDGHTLPEAVEQVSILTDHLPKAIFVDKGYRGVAVAGVAIWRSGQKWRHAGDQEGDPPAKRHRTGHRAYEK